MSFPLLGHSRQGKTYDKVNFGLIFLLISRLIIILHTPLPIGFLPLPRGDLFILTVDQTMNFFPFLRHSRQVSDGYIINNESDVAKENEYKTG